MVTGISLIGQSVKRFKANNIEQILAIELIFEPDPIKFLPES